MLSALVGVSAIVPQGWHAVQLAGLEHSEAIQGLYAWGLTDIVNSYWLKAVMVLIGGNFVAVALRTYWARQQDAARPRVTASAPYHIKLEAPQPERAVEGIRSVLTAQFGRPVREAVSGSKVTLTFATSPRAYISPLLTHLGLVSLLLGAIWAYQPVPMSYSVPRATLEVRHPQSGYVGTFDMAAQEPQTFFQFPAEYSIARYEIDQDGLGPAVQMQRVDQRQRRMDAFWVYLNAPEGFDAKHRGGEVEILAKKMAIVPKSGAGMGSRGESVLLLVGLGLLAIGMVELGRPIGELVVESEGRDVEMFGLPVRAGDARFSTSFDHWALMARWALSLS